MLNAIWSCTPALVAAELRAIAEAAGLPFSTRPTLDRFRQHKPEIARLVGEGVAYAEIGRRTGMAAVTVRKLAAELREEGVLSVPLRRSAPAAVVPMGAMLGS